MADSRDYYEQIATNELLKIVRTLDDAINRWEIRVSAEPFLRTRINYAYDNIKQIFEVIERRLEPMDSQLDA